MTKEYLVKRIEFAIYKNFTLMRVELPIKTGRLQYRAFKLKKTASGWTLYIDLNISPYAVYLDDKGKTAGWWKAACQRFIQRLNIDLQGIVSNVKLPKSA